MTFAFCIVMKSTQVFDPQVYTAFLRMLIPSRTNRQRSRRLEIDLFTFNRFVSDMTILSVLEDAIHVAYQFCL